MTHKAAFVCAAILMAFAPLFAQKPNLPRADVPDVAAPPPANGPNLIVSKLTVQSVANNGIGYTIEITNIGNQPASLAGVKAQAFLYTDGKGKKQAGDAFSFVSQNLAAGQTETKVIKTSLDPAGYKNLCLTVDHSNALKETQEGDNDLCAKLSVKSTASNLDISPVTYSNGELQLFWKQETPSVFYFKVKNDGPLKTAASTTKVTITRSGQSAQTVEIATPAIKPYSTVQVSFSYSGPACFANIQVTCDTKNVNAETDEANNTAKMEIACEE